MNPNRLTYCSSTREILKVDLHLTPDDLIREADRLKAKNIEYLTVTGSKATLNYFKKETTKEAATRYSKKAQKEIKKKLSEIQEVSERLEYLLHEIEELDKTDDN